MFQKNRIKYQEIYDKIEEIVSSKENIELTQEEKDKYGITDDGEAKSIDDYWEKVIINSRYFTITDKDKVILKYLTKVKSVKFPEKVNDFRVDFYFSPNEFFNNEIISKKYIYGKDATLKKAEGTVIDWTSKDKNTTIDIVKKKIKKGKRFIYENKEEKVDSFFSFFSQVEDMTFLSDEVTFFKEDLFVNQLDYYMDIVAKTKNGGLDDDDDLDDEGDGEHGNKHGGNDQANDGKKEKRKTSNVWDDDDDLDEDSLGANKNYVIKEEGENINLDDDFNEEEEEENSAEEDDDNSSFFDDNNQVPKKEIIKESSKDKENIDSSVDLSKNDEYNNLKPKKKYSCKRIYIKYN